MKKSMGLLISCITFAFVVSSACHLGPLPQCVSSRDCRGQTCVAGLCQKKTPTIPSKEQVQGDGGEMSDETPDGPAVDKSICRPSPEVCDGKDNNCDGKIDEGCADTWAWRAGSIGRDQASQVATDAKGNTYIAGSFSGGTSNKEQPKGTTFGKEKRSTHGYRDIFVAKFTAQGQLVWVATGGGQSDDYVNALAVDAQGKVTIAGRMGYGPLTFGAIKQTPSRNDKIYIARLNEQGKFVWLRTAGHEERITPTGSGSFSAGVSVAGLTLLQDGSAVIYGSHGLSSSDGRFTRSATQFGNKRTSTVGHRDMYLAKIDAKGSFLWARSLGGRGKDTANGITSTAKGELLLKGSITGPGSIGEVTAGADETLMIVAKLSTAGSINWVVSGKGYSTYGESGGIALDAKENIIIAGGFPMHHKATTFQIGKYNLVHQAKEYGPKNVFAAKIDGKGDVMWAKSVACKTECTANALSVKGQRIYITGSFRGSASFGSHAVKADGASPAFPGQEDIFVAGMDENGSWQWAKRTGGAGGDTGLGIAVGAKGKINVVGSYTGPAKFGNKQLDGYGYSDIFLWRFLQIDPS